METVYGAEPSVLKPAEIKLVISLAHAVSADVVAPPCISRVGRGIGKIGLEFKTLPGADGVAGESKGETGAAET